MKLFSLSLRSKLIGLTLFVIALIGVGTIVNLNQFENKYKEKIRNQMHTSAVKLGKSVTAQLYERYGDAQAFAVNRSIASLNKEMMVADLDHYVKLYGIYDLILVVDKNGKLVANNTLDPKGKAVNEEKIKSLDYSKMPWFESALSGHFTEDKNTGYSGTYVEDFEKLNIFEQAFGEKKFGSIFSAQIKDSRGEVVGVLANFAGSRWFESEVSDFHQQIVEENLLHSEILIFNKDGKLISHSDVESETKKTSFESDDKIILNSSLNDYHPGLSEILKTTQSGFSEMLHESKGIVDLVGFHVLKNSKSIDSLGWTVIVEDSTDDSYAIAHAAKSQSYIILLVVCFFGLILSIWAGIIISKSVAKVTETLAVNAEEVSDASNKIAASSSQLSETATEQAAALQETVAAVDEISAMVEKNAEAAQKSRQVSQDSRDAASKGREIVSNMILAIQEIDHSNDEISNQMSESNIKLQEITKLINDISNKTTVINEIVFQTKLLSFNASVEAARAGEAGKGFAVVAEEVGNLAQMSGNAAKEISALLDESVQKVNTIVNESKSKVERLMSVSKEKVAHGSRTAQECNNSLDEIMNQVQTVDSLVSEIAVASQEQSTGVREVSRAMAQMEQATQQNASVANATSVAGEQIRGQSEVLNTLVSDLAYIVSGQANGHIVVAKSPVKKKIATHKFEVKSDLKNETSKDHQKKSGKLLNLASAKKTKAQDNSTHSIDKSEENGSDAKNAGSSSGTEKRIPLASGADYVPAGDDPGFNE
jgi:methyl-accepting chemotaxis protein